MDSTVRAQPQPRLAADMACRDAAAPLEVAAALAPVVDAEVPGEAVVDEPAPLPTSADNFESLVAETVTPEELVHAEGLLPLPSTKLTATHYSRYVINLWS